MCYLKFIHQHNLTRFSSSFVFRGYYFLFLSLTLTVVFVCVCMCLRVITLQLNRPLKFIQSSVVGGGACELSTVLRCAQSLGRVRFFMTLWTVACQPPLCMGFSSKNTGVGCRALLQGIFPIQGSRSPTLHKDSLPSKCVYLVVSKIAHLEKEMATHSSTLAWKIPFLCLCCPLGAHSRLVEPYLLCISW